MFFVKGAVCDTLLGCGLIREMCPVCFLFVRTTILLSVVAKTDQEGFTAELNQSLKL